MKGMDWAAGGKEGAPGAECCHWRKRAWRAFENYFLCPRIPADGEASLKEPMQGPCPGLIESASYAPRQCWQYKLDELKFAELRRCFVMVDQFCNFVAVFAGFDCELPLLDEFTGPVQIELRH
jgi:hypothetical protein